MPMPMTAPSGPNSALPARPPSNNSTMAMPVMSTAERRRFARICSHMVVAAVYDRRLPCPAALIERRYNSERHLRRFTGGFVLDLEKFAAPEVEHAGDDFR